VSSGLRSEATREDDTSGRPRGRGAGGGAAGGGADSAAPGGCAPRGPLLSNTDVATTTDPTGDPTRFGTLAFYASVGRAFIAMCAVVPVLFAIELLDQAMLHRLDMLGGIIPHDIDGLDGIVVAPFLHTSFAHVTVNAAPLILLGTFVLAGGVRRFLVATVIIAVVSGVGTWLTGDPGTVVVGASGVIFGYLGALLTRGVVERSWWNIAVGLLIALLYGWQLVALLPTDARVSWQAHLFGFVGGILAAVVVRRRRPRVAPPGPSVPPAGSEPIGLPDTLTLRREIRPPGEF
jgi:membrane associated rhomboid family serine protease